jgi:hypothetical protein
MRLPKPDLKFLVTAKAIVVAMDGNANFPNAGALVAAAKAAVDQFEEAVDDRAAELPGAVEAREDAKPLLRLALDHLRDHVQSVVDTRIDEAGSIAESARMSLRRVPVRDKPPFAVKDGKVSGLVLLIARALLGARTYYWELSEDKLTWVILPETSGANTSVAGLTPGKTYYFRFRAHTRKGMTEYSSTVGLIVR